MPCLRNDFMSDKIQKEAETYPLQIQINDTALAGKYADDLDVCRTISCVQPLFLSVSDGVIGLGTLDQPKQGIISVDFTGGTMAHRRKYGGGKKSEAVAKACFGSMDKPVIFDGTAGLGRDAFVNAYLGAEVHLFERNPVVRLLLKHGIERAVNSIVTQEDEELYRNRLILEDVSSLKDYHGGVLPDTVYLDPMYPERQKNALVKKEMRVFHYLIGSDNDREELLACARSIAQRRIVMKNPKWAPVLDEKSCVSAIVTKNHRFDIYMPKK